ncbi:MAG: chemotaxis family two-component system response regulator Rcp1 [Myxococcota bacterium]
MTYPRPFNSAQESTVNNELYPIPILVVEDSPDDCDILADAVSGARLANAVHFVEDGAEAMEYLSGEGRFADRGSYPLPGLVFLDINLPKYTGLEVLAAIRANDALADLPVVMLTVSNSDEDVLRAYELETVVYIQKPVTADNLRAVMQSLEQFKIQLLGKRP